MKANLTKEAEDKAERDLEDEIVEKIVDASTVEIPQAMIDHEAEDMVHEFEYRLMYQGLKLDDYLKYLNMTREQLEDQYKDQAAKTVKVRLVMETLIKAENINMRTRTSTKRLRSLQATLLRPSKSSRNLCTKSKSTISSTLS